MEFWQKLYFAQKYAHTAKVNTTVFSTQLKKLSLTFLFLMQVCSPKKLPSVMPHLIEVMVYGQRNTYFPCRQSIFSICRPSLSYALIWLLQTKINRIMFKRRQINHCAEVEVRQVDSVPFEANILTVYQSYFSLENLLYITFQRFWILAQQLIRVVRSSFQGFQGSFGVQGFWAFLSLSSSLSCLFQLRSSMFLRYKAKAISWYLKVSFLQCSKLELTSCSRLLFNVSGVTLVPREVLGVLASCLPLMPERLRSICGLWHLGTLTSGLKFAFLQNYSALQRYSSVLEFVTLLRILALEISLKSFGLAFFILYQSSYFFIALKFIILYKGFRK